MYWIYEAALGATALASLLLFLHHRTIARRLKVRLKERDEQLQSVHSRKNHFIATLAHELRSPMAAIDATCTLLDLTLQENDKAQQSVKLIRRQLAQQRYLVDEIMELSRLQHGKISIDRQPVDLVEFIRVLVTDYRRIIELAGLEFAVRVPTGPVLVSADPVRLRQVLQNLLQNAVKCTDAGGTITLSLREDADRSFVYICVRDTGIGLDPAALGRIFQVFEQEDEMEKRNRGGLGLGLALADQLVKLHGGRLTAQSDGPNLGTRFTVEIPMSKEGA